MAPGLGAAQQAQRSDLESGACLIHCIRRGERDDEEAIEGQDQDKGRTKADDLDRGELGAALWVQTSELAGGAYLIQCIRGGERDEEEAIESQDEGSGWY